MQYSRIMYPQSMTFDIPLNEKDYVRISIYFNMNRNDIVETSQAKELLQNAFSEIIKHYDIT